MDDERKDGPMAERRKFLLGIMRSAGAAAVGGLAWSGFMEGKKAYPFILRPPGAIEEDDFLAKCTKCGMCAEACPYDSLIIAKPGDERPLGTPYFLARDNPCRMCRDIPCTTACPSGALEPSLVGRIDVSGKERLDIDLARMGIAVIDRESCVAYWGIQCDACYRACPLIDRALIVEYTRNERTGKHAILAPVVRSNACTGCGLCEHACITRKAAIMVLPRRMALGESSARYIKGWDSTDEKRLEDLPAETGSVSPRSGKSPLDYLNRDDF